MCSWSDGSQDVSVVNSSYLDITTISSQIFGSSYAVYRQDRNELTSNKRSGGGVLLACRSKFKSRHVILSNCANVEQLWIALSFSNYTLYICAIYIPPDRVNDDDLIDQHLESLSLIENRMISTFLV